MASSTTATARAQDQNLRGAGGRIHASFGHLRVDAASPRRPHLGRRSRPRSRITARCLLPAVTEILRLHINGEPRDVGVPGHFTLLEALRYVIGLTGSKQGCDKGDCGACTVLLDGVPVLSCITPVQEAEGHKVVTVEGLSDGLEPHPLQDEFDLKGAAQCGFCTPGILCSAAALLAADPTPGTDAIREALSGNLCRCTGYTKIYEAVERAGVRLEASDDLRERFGARVRGER